MSKRKNDFALHMFGAVVLLILGAAFLLLPPVMPDVFSNDFLNTVLKWVGIVALVFGALLLVVALADAAKRKKEKKLAEQAESDLQQQQQQQFQQQLQFQQQQQQYLQQQQFLQQQQIFQQQQFQQYQPEQNDKKKRKEKPLKVKAHKAEKRPKEAKQARYVSDADVQTAQNVTYIPYESVYNFVNMGNRQSTEEKFAEIAKMDRTQFVIYVARLFSLKGYQVKFTPVIDNYDIDLLVEKMGVTIAVGCILTTKVLCDKDIRCVAEGRQHYQVKDVMTITNMYFDRSALDFAKRERMSLVDANILAEDFMK